MAENKNLSIWNELCKVDPNQTKPFKRAGGFSGTATKPIWLTKRMTEYFGPCGIGWGTTKPEYQIVTAGDEILVYCTVGLWHTKQDYLVYGVGGDKVRASQKSGLFNSDEAFKGAHTDAIGNAMKSIGMIADVHMGLFDDNKYVRQMREEFGDQDALAEKNAPANDDAEFVKGAIQWMRTQKDPAAIHEAWSVNLERFNNLSDKHKADMQGVRDEVLKKIAPPQIAAQPVQPADSAKDEPDAREKWVNEQIVWIKAQTDMTAIAQFWKSNSKAFKALPPDLLAPLTAAKDVTKAKIERNAPIVLDDEVRY
jgi:hypothetical protein